MGPVARAASSFRGRLHPPRPSCLPLQGGLGLRGHDQADGMQTAAALHEPAQAQSLASRGLFPPWARALRSSCCIRAFLWPVLPPPPPVLLGLWVHLQPSVSPCFALALASFSLRGGKPPLV